MKHTRAMATLARSWRLLRSFRCEPNASVPVAAGFYAASTAADPSV